jgi:hypothetical protein
MEFGTALHTRILEPREFSTRYLVAPKISGRTKEGKKARAEFEEMAKGKTVISEEDYTMLDAMFERFKLKNIANLLNGVKLETCIVWVDPDTGLLCKARLDMWNEDFNYVGDLKTTRDATLGKFSKSVYNFGYHQQAAFYSDGVNVLAGSAPDFILFAIEKTPPYDCIAYQVNDTSMQAGRMQYRHALRTIKRCQTNNEWPGYPDGVQEISISDWALKECGVHEYNLEM